MAPRKELPAGQFHLTGLVETQLPHTKVCVQPREPSEDESGATVKARLFSGNWPALRAEQCLCISRPRPTVSFWLGGSLRGCGQWASWAEDPVPSWSLASVSSYLGPWPPRSQDGPFQSTCHRSFETFLKIYLYLYCLFWLCWVLVAAWGTLFHRCCCGMQTLSCSMQNLASRPGIEPGPPGLGTWSFSLWKLGKFLKQMFEARLYWYVWEAQGFSRWR